MPLLTSIHPRDGLLHKRTNFTKEHNKWNYAHTRRIIVCLNIDKERDMIEWIENKDNMQGTVKRLIRAEMEREQAKPHATIWNVKQGPLNAF